MSKEMISTAQATLIIVLYLTGSSMLFGVSGVAKNDVWIGVILAMLMAIPTVIIYSRIMELHMGKNLFGIVEFVFGKWIGKAIVILYTWYALHLGALVLRNISEFIQIVSFPESPQLATLTMMTILSIWFVKSGLEVIGRWAVFVFPIILFFTLVIVLLSVPLMDRIHLQPILYDGLSPVIQEATTLFSFPFAETVLFLVVFDAVKGKRGVRRAYIYSLFIAGFMILIATIKNILVLGPTLPLFNFPAHTATRMVEIGEFLQRIEIITDLLFIPSSLVKISICLLAATIGLAKLFEFPDHKVLAFPTGFLMMALAVILYGSTLEMFDWALKIYKYYAFPFQILIPLLVWIAVEIKARRQKQDTIQAS